MSEQTSKIAMATLRKAQPWRSGIAWWVVLFEGVIALGIGLFILLQDTPGMLTVQLLAAYLLIISIERALLGFRDRIPQVIVAERMLRAGIGLTVGLIILLDAWQRFMTVPAPLVILSLGWLLIGVVGLWEWLIARKQLGLGMGGLIFPVVSTLFGLLMLGSRMALGPVLLQWVGILATVAGIALLGYSFVLYRKTAAANAVSVGQAAPEV